MRRIILRAFIPPDLLGVLLCLPVALILTASCRSATEKTSDQTIDHLIADLGSDYFEIRDAAMRALKERIDAIPALRQVRHASDLEVRRLVQDILATLERKRALQELSKSKVLG